MRGVVFMFQSSIFVNAIDAHTAGEPVRVITSGLPRIPGETMLERMEWFEAHYPNLRNLMMREPRGHRDMFGCILTPPATEDGDFGVLYTNVAGQATMCGHGTIGVTKVVLETGIIPAVEGDNVVRIDTPAGRITSHASVRDGHVREVSFINVPSFVFRDTMTENVPGFGDLTFAISYGGDFYIIIDSRQLGDLEVTPEHGKEIARLSMNLMNWANGAHKIVHPEQPDISGIYGVIVTGKHERRGDCLISRETCIFGDGSIDRSPCGTGTSARMALLYAQGKMGLGDRLDNYSILNTKFRGSVERTVEVGGRQGIIPRITGSAWITGFNQFILEPDDPFAEGFLI
jgi:proline racemase